MRRKIYCPLSHTLSARRQVVRAAADHGRRAAAAAPGKTFRADPYQIAHGVPARWVPLYVRTYVKARGPALARPPIVWTAARGYHEAAST